MTSASGRWTLLLKASHVRSGAPRLQSRVPMPGTNQQTVRVGWQTGQQGGPVSGHLESISLGDHRGSKILLALAGPLMQSRTGP